MATKKKMLQAAAGSATGGAGLDITDVFSTYLYEGNGSTQVIQNGIKLGQRFGSVQFAQSTSDYLSFSSAITLSGDFTIETWLYSDPTFSAQNQILGSDYAGTGGTNNQVYLQNTSNKLGFYDGSSAHVSNGGVPQNTWSHVAITRSGSTIAFYIDGQSSGTSTSSASVEFKAIGSLIALNFFKGYIADLRIVSGSVVYTSNFTPPSEPLTAISGTQVLACQGSNPFSDTSNNTTITKNGSVTAEATLDPYGLAEDGEGGLVWFKNRTTTGTDHNLYDTERGDLRLRSNSSGGELDQASLVSVGFNANGFSLNASGNYTDWNASGEDYASWTFRKAPKFFDVVTYTGTGVARTISHNLGSVPGCIIVKRTDTGGINWTVYHREMDANPTQPARYFLELNQTGARTFDESAFGTLPTDSVFTVGTDNSTNASGGTYVAYVFAHNDGDGGFGPDGDADIIKCGSYVGNSSGDGPEIDLGFEPQWVMIKNTTNARSWFIYDSMRGMTFGGNNPSPVDQELYADDSGSEQGVNRIAPLPNGFKLEYADGTQTNFSGNNYIYMAIRRGPLAQPESGTEVFDVAFGDSVWGTGEYSTQHTTSNITVDMFMGQSVNGGPNYTQNRLVDPAQYMSTDSQAAESTSGGWSLSNGQTGIFHDTSRTDSSRIMRMFRRAPGFFDVVAYTGDGVAGRTVSHNLGVAPEMMWVKRRNDVESWPVYVGLLGNDKYLQLNGIGESKTNTLWWGSTTPTTTDFTIGNDSALNSASGTYIAYLFATLPGVSKVGSFTGTGGSGQTIDCGFTSGARFVLIKRTDSSTYGDWYVWDSERGIVAGNDPRLSLNTTSAEVLADTIDPHSSGFSTVPSTIVDQSGASYIFYAIA